ncbi:hypothetical protein [Thalassolituus maritimus]|jgi:hypothetical protein|uniref:Uncharacterized protein n=1 Tax=Thalassolituus maritimus TaxID=484498 RepID=A0ABP9ZZK3_9GAMM|nr:hypothetical protein [Pseudomonadota bacterium]MEC8103785.1 hypothetical protein [Pseudomonadota bacterium]MEC8523134.1 hypothetical protein [Pseudomonadota bacterium]|tara:strand:- start:266 stop:457 length:192 start_codon:yes stop_codon:yes gene_type:complete
MDLVPADIIETARKQGRHASATVSGRRREGFLLGNRFVFSDQSEVMWMQAGPGEFRELKIWRK